MTNEVVVDKTRMAQFFVFSPVCIARNIIGKILNEFCKGDVVVAIWVKILRSISFCNAFTSFPARVPFVQTKKFVFKGRDQANKRLANEDEFKISVNPLLPSFLRVRTQSMPEVPLVNVFKGVFFQASKITEHVFPCCSTNLWNRAVHKLVSIVY